MPLYQSVQGLATPDSPPFGGSERVSRRCPERPASLRHAESLVRQGDQHEAGTIGWWYLPRFLCSADGCTNRRPGLMAPDTNERAIRRTPVPLPLLL